MNKLQELILYEVSIQLDGISLNDLMIKFEQEISRELRLLLTRNQLRFNNQMKLALPKEVPETCNSKNYKECYKNTQDFENFKNKCVDCSTCGESTPMTGTKKCDACWEVEHRLLDYLTKGGNKAKLFVKSTLAK